MTAATTTARRRIVKRMLCALVVTFHTKVFWIYQFRTVTDERASLGELPGLVNILSQPSDSRL
jgi:hypothetical protein